MTDGQHEVIAFLSDPASYCPPVGHVELIETHGAFVFLAGAHAFKIKRAVAYEYMDFSTLAKRQAALARELEINRPNAPGLYLGLVAITRSGSGGLALGGAGPVLEWALQMVRFDEDNLLSRLAERDRLTGDLLRALADEVVGAHARAPVSTGASASRGLNEVIAELERAFGQQARTDMVAWAATARGRLTGLTGLLQARLDRGLVRRCHGDLHLNNIVLWQGKPTLFDAIEFDVGLATIDLLYDLAFLLMDLDVRGQRAGANLVLNRYLWRRNEPLDLDGLLALPLFLALRAAIRAMVGWQRAAQLPEGARAAAEQQASSLAQAAIAYLAPPPPRLIAVGGLSGTGKSTLAAVLAPGIGAAPGALHVRSDLERKSLLGVEETERLPDGAYDAATTAKVYALLIEKARAGLAGSHCVVVDAVFSQPEERAGIGAVATAQSVPFTGLWLTAGREAMLRRVAARTGDASDATPAIVERQIARGAGAIDWTEIDAGGTPGETLKRAKRALAQT